MDTYERELPAMGSTARIVVVGGGVDLLERAVARLAALEARWSRFTPDSDVSRLNAAQAAGEPPPDISADTELLLARAAEGFRITGGRFDPYRLDAIVAAGYDRPMGHPAVAAAARRSAAGFDPGGIGKGLAADIISSEIIEGGAAGALVSVGGDLRVRGVAPDSGTWRIDVEDPRDGGVLTTIDLADGAVATSSQLKRRWTQPDGTPRHHLIDPATGTSATSPVLAATVIAADAWQAEVLTKVAFLDAFGDGAFSDDAGLELVESLGAAALVVTDALVATTSRWHRFELTTEAAR